MKPTAQCMHAVQTMLCRSFWWIVQRGGPWRRGVTEWRRRGPRRRRVRIRSDGRDCGPWLVDDGVMKSEIRFHKQKQANLSTPRTFADDIKKTKTKCPKGLERRAEPLTAPRPMVNPPRHLRKKQKKMRRPRSPHSSSRKVLSTPRRRVSYA